MFDYIRVAAAVPKVKVGDVKANVQEILKQTDEALAAGAQIIVFPELSVTGYTCADLFFQKLCKPVLCRRWINWPNARWEKFYIDNRCACACYRAALQLRCDPGGR